MKNLTLLKELIVEKLPLVKVMVDYGVDFVYDPDGVDEVQFRCPFHGKDNKPSARLYNYTQSCYCWYCKKRWDVVSFVMDSENIPFKEAVNFIISKYKIDTSSASDEPEIKKAAPKISEQNMEMERLEKKIKNLRNKVDLNKYKALVTAFYMISRDNSKGLDTIESINKLRNKIKGIA